MTPDFDWPLFLRQLHAREHSWNDRRITYDRGDAVPFMPYPLPLFAALLIDAVQAMPAAYDEQGDPRQLSFLDVGCGPGTKMLLAHQLFGLIVAGLDIVPEYVAEARHQGLDAQVTDAFTYAGYNMWDIVLVNRPSGLQDDLERLITDQMKPRAVLIAINWRNDPGKWGWEAVSQEWGEPVRGVWVKPEGIVHLAGRELMGPTSCCGKLPGELHAADSMSPDLPLVTCPEAAVR